jgi:hypothetical protein
LILPLPDAAMHGRGSAHGTLAGHQVLRGAADFAVLAGGAIRNLRSSLDQWPISWQCSTLVRSPRMQSE